ncbi:hypothetical protein NFI96_032182 [Prochilodus magdalenae]|nr:hypothetical protein NFI96_032182 [Prochilodus magdalenae]
MITLLTTLTLLTTAWYKQSLGNVPEPVLRLFGDGRKPRYTPGFSDGRFTVDEEVLDLSIKGIKEEDAGTYFCGKVQKNFVEFGSGTLLFLEAEKMNPHPLTEMVVKTGASVTLQCSVQSLTSDCSGEHSVYWFRPGSGESHPGIIYTHGNRSDQCKSSSEADSSTQSCVYKLPKRKLSLSDAGTYYCAVAACGQILFGNGTEVNVQEGAAMQDPAGQAMDADHSDHEEGLVVKRALVAQGELIGRHEQLLQQIMQQLTQLTQHHPGDACPVPGKTYPDLDPGWSASRGWACHTLHPTSNPAGGAPCGDRGVVPKLHSPAPPGAGVSVVGTTQPLH